ncbi:MAG TPA: YfhO family protein [Pyrinomonadaceae bacterium]|nr:YfhO family protein [Pyrinomonadaceae bacterium]
MTRPSNPRPRKGSGFAVALNRDRAAALFVSLAPVVYFLPALLAGYVLCPDDGTIFNTPLRVAAANITLAGDAPLWNPYIFGGMPLLGSAQGGLLFPLNWLYLVFSPQLATNLMVVASYALAGLGAYLYARRAGAGFAGALVTSLAWQWGGFLVGQIGHINIVQTGACLPWVLWALDGYGMTGQRRWGVALAAFVALQTFVGHQQTLAYSLLLAAVYAVACGYTFREARARYLSSLMFLAAGVLLAAVQILPTFELLRNSPRADATYDFFTSFSLTPGMLRTFLAPYALGGGDGWLFRAPYVGPPYYGEMAGYVGALGLMLAACAVVFRRDARTKFWTAAALVCLLLALGRYAPLKFYKLIYYVPVLNLFRVPARHLMEAEFALAVLAGRGLTALAAARDWKETSTRIWSRASTRAAAVGACVVVLTLLVVTLGRPDAFKLGREAPVGLMRAPELFVPVIFACASAWALWAFARRRRGATFMLVALLACDLALWGQSSGWRLSSPKSDGELFREPETLKIIREHGAGDAASYRILTAPHPFDPAAAPVPPSVSHSTRWTLWTQPDVYMMRGVQNAAGYDGFGLARYQRLAGDMKVWGELTDPDASLRGEGREIDLLGVRYLVSMPAQVNTAATGDGANGGTTVDSSKMTAAPAAPPTPAPDFPAATQKFGDVLFAESDLGLPNLGAGRSLSFAVAPVEADRVALVTNLSWSEDVPDGTVVARVRLRAKDGRVFEFPLRAGADTSEWAHDRADLRARVRHKRAAVASSYPVADAKGNYEGHTYVASFALPERATVEGGEVVVESSPKWPELLLGVFRVSLLDAAAGKTYPLRREWMTIERAERTQAASAAAGAGAGAASGTSGFNAQPGSKQGANVSTQGANVSTPGAVENGAGKDAAGGASEAGQRWRLLGRTAQADVYENARALPRAWLASEARALGEQATLDVIRKGRLPEGATWEPLRTALVESEPVERLGGASGESAAGGGAASVGSAEVTLYEPSRVDVRTKSGGPAILVLGENHYPGWRAYLDGRSVGVLRVDYNLRGVYVPAGEHEVRFVYRPKSVYIGLAVSLLAALALVLWWRRLLPEQSVLRYVSRVRGRKAEAREAAREVA